MRIGGSWVTALLGLAACSVDIQHGLEETEANQIVVALDRAGIPASKQREDGRPPTWNVRVASSEATRAWQVLRREELPRSRSKGFEVFSKGGLIPTQTEERALYQQALSGEITRMLLSYPGVIDARVLVSMPPARVFGSQAPAARPTASVLLKVTGAEGASFKTDVQGLVAGAVPGLDAKDIAVVALPAKAGAAEGPDLVRMGPFVVTRGSQSGLQIALIIGAALLLVLGAAVVYGALRLRRARARVRELEAAHRAAQEVEDGARAA
jgi:type III secretion system YscJ/HrcJ family lipoprotein